MRRRWFWYGAVVLGLCLTVSTVSVRGFAEEEFGFRDRDGTYYPPTGDFPAGRIDTIHDDLTFVLAVAAPCAEPVSDREWRRLSGVPSVS